MIRFIKKILRKILPDELSKKLIEFYFYKFKLKQVQVNHKKALEKVRKKEIIKVAFFLIHESVWKYEGVYKLMEQDKRFEPVIIVCPFTSYGLDTMTSHMNQAYINFVNKGYRVIKTFDEIDGKWLNVKKKLKPDIIFFTNPWKLTKEEYYINYYKDTLTCYVPYFFHVTKHLRENYGGLTQNLVWKAFYETNIHLNYAKLYSKNKALNVSVTGYPGLDPFWAKKNGLPNPWKIQDKKTKRIIWAPHHTIAGQDAGLKFSNFETYAFKFLKLAKKYNSEIQFAFKPHPLLKPKLYKDSKWGVSKTDEYYFSWNNLENGILAEGEYVELFLSSDALIHDSGSFSVEYLATTKPTLYTLNDPSQLNSLNEFGKKAIEQHYKAFSFDEIEDFITKVVLQNNDPMKKERMNFITDYLIPPNNINASQNILNDILNSIKS